MRIWYQLLAAGLAGLGGLTAVSAAAPGEVSAAAARPVVSSISPKTVASGQRIAIKGHRFVPGRRHNRVVFLGASGRRDDVTAKATRATSSRKLVLSAPTARVPSGGRGAVSGRIQVINRFGKSKPSTAKVTFDEDKDGLSNERELEIGTDPRKRDTDGDGIPDGRDKDPTSPPGSEVAPGPAPGPGPGPSPAPQTACPVVAASGPAAGVSSSFAGLANVITEARSRIAHSAYAGSGFNEYCLYRKRRQDPDSTYQLVGNSTSPGAGTIQDGQRPAKQEDYLFRTDAAASGGVVVGANTVPARGAGSIANVNGWAQLHQTCTDCGSAAVPAGFLRTRTTGDGSSGPPVGEIAVFDRQLQLSAASEWVGRALAPAPPAGFGNSVEAEMTVSAQHPATVRGAGTVADVTDSAEPWISVALRATADGTPNGKLEVVLTDSDGVSTVSPDLLSLGATTNSYLVIDPQANGTYEVRYKTNQQGNDVILGTPPMPAGLSTAWLSLKEEVSRDEQAEHEAGFDSVAVVGQGEGGGFEDIDEDFGGVPVPVTLAPGFVLDTVTADLQGPTAIAFASNGDMYITEKQGLVKRLASGAATPTTVLDIRSRVNTPVGADQGLTGMALNPSFGGGSDYVYLYYTVEGADPEETRTVSRVERFTLGAGGSFDVGSGLVLVGSDNAAPGTGDTCPPDTSPPDTTDCLPSDAYTHSSGSLAFGADGMLWVSVPDGASPEGSGPGGTDPLALNVQSADSLRGKLLRVNPATGDGMPGNPSFNAGDPDSPASRTWVRGFRNPFRLAQRPDAGQPWYVTDVGWGAWEEVDVVPSGSASGNFGWPCWEGLEATAYGCSGSVSNAAPVHLYDSSGVDHAVLGAAFYTGDAYPVPWKPAAGEAAFYFTDYPSGELTRLTTSSSNVKVNTQTFGTGFAGAVMITEGPLDPTNPGGDTALYVVDIGSIVESDGNVWRIEYTGP